MTKHKGRGGTCSGCRKVPVCRKEWARSCCSHRKRVLLHGVSSKGAASAPRPQGAGEPALPCLYLHGALLALLPDVAHGDEAEHQVCQVQLLMSSEVLGAQLRHLPGKPLGARSRSSNAKAPVVERLPCQLGGTLLVLPCLYASLPTHSAGLAPAALLLVCEQGQ